MVTSIRKAFNAQFTSEKYSAFLEEVEQEYPHALDFRIAESPVFISKALGKKMIDTCEHIIDTILAPGFKERTDNSIPNNENVANDTGHSHFMAFDFGICTNESGLYEPALIEMQGFPTLFGFQAFYPELFKKHFTIPEHYSNYFNSLNMESYLEELKKVILGNCTPEEVILLEIRPDQQKTRIDFYCTRTYVGIEPLCITQLIAEGDALYYMRNGAKQRIRRIYNRIIFDELNAVQSTLGQVVDIRQKYDVEWITHPNWFYRISKYTLPFLNHPFIPKTTFLNEIKEIPQDLERYVLKPLFSFAGQGVIIDLTPADLHQIKDPENWILQKKVNYADCIETPDIPAKAEVRLMYIWKDGDTRPKLVTNLARLSKGKMIGTRYNKDKKWVGGSVAFFEQ